MWGNHIQTVHLHFGTFLTTTPLGGLRFFLLKASDPEQEKTMQKPGKLSCKLSKKNNNKKKKKWQEKATFKHSTQWPSWKQDPNLEGKHQVTPEELKVFQDSAGQGQKVIHCWTHSNNKKYFSS